MDQQITKPDLTLKQRKWIKVYIETGNATEAAMQVYDCNSREYASQIGYENVRKLDYTAFLEEAGVTDKLLQQKIMDGLDATKVVSAVKTSKEASADSTDFIDVPDFMARHKYLETALKLKKRLVDKVEHTGEDGGPIKVNILAYGVHDPVSISSNAVHDTGTGGPAQIPGPELAPQGTQNNAGSKPADQVGQ